jgi:hypothetical protein
MRELAGAFGDYGTFLPFAVGYIKDQRAHIGGGRPGI